MNNMNIEHHRLLILLNGTSSSGKSSILQIFHQLKPDFAVFKVDDYFPDEMRKKARELGWQEKTGIHPWLYLIDYVDKQTSKSNFSTEVRAYLFDNISPMYLQAQQVLINGKNVIIDTVFEYDPEYEKFTSYFKEFNCFKVLVYCPLDIIVERVKKRNLLGIEKEARTAFQSFEQFPAIYKVQENNQEQVVATCSSERIKQALHDAIQELIENKIPQKYIPRIKEFECLFISLFKLDEQKEIKLVARHQYDLILNSAHSTPEQLAQTIVHKLPRE